MTNTTKPGHYVAICNKADFSGHFIKIFEYPQGFIDDWLAKPEMLELGQTVAPNAEWYFLNRIDLTSSLEGVYPVSIFDAVCFFYPTGARGGEA